MEIFWVTLVGLICGMGSVLDERQTHRPLVACTLIGLALGDLKTGIMVGGALELFAIGWMNVGAAMAPDAALASVIATILVIKTGQNPQESIAIAMPIAIAGQMLTIFVRTIAVFFQHQADRFAKDANFLGIELCHYSALLLQGLRVAIPAAIVIATADTTGVKAFLDKIPVEVVEGLRIAGGVVVVVGYAMVINMMSARALMPFFFLGFVVAVFSNYNLIGLGIIGAVLAILYIQLSPRFNKSAAGNTSAARQAPLADDELEGL